MEKKIPSKETVDFKECHAWKDKSCCTADFTAELAQHRVRNIWNFTWNHCSNLSQVKRFYIKKTAVTALLCYVSRGFV